MSVRPAFEPTDFRLLLASTRWAVHTFFISLRKRGLPSLVVEPIASTAAELGDEIVDLDQATVVAVDIAARASAAVELCEELHDRRPTLPIVALTCCPQGVNPWHLQRVLSVGASVLDLDATPEEAVRALESVARGSAVLHLHLEHRSLLRDVLSRRTSSNVTRAHLLELLSLGFPDHEIGRRLHLSPHTVKHQIESLRDEVGARNRIELAAWAGRYGFYPPDSRPPTEPVPVRLTRSRPS